MTSPSEWAQIAKQLQGDLPKPLINRRCFNRRCRLLPKILHEWSHTDLPERLSLDSRRAENRKKIEKLQIIKERALDLLNALKEIDETSRVDLVWQLAIVERGASSPERSTPLTFRQAELWTRVDRLREESEFLTNLADIEPENYYWPFGSTRPHTISAYLVLKDLAAIFEWLTGRPATREVGRDSHREISAFYRFASTLWPVVFRKGTVGLPSAMKNWGHAKRHFRERSPLLFNMDPRHPAWGIFEP